MTRRDRHRAYTKADTGRQARSGTVAILLVLASACSSHDGTTGSNAVAVNQRPPDTDADGADGGATATVGGPSPAAPLTSYASGSFQGTVADGYGFVIGVGDASPWVVGTDYNIWHYDNDSPPPRAWIQEANSANSSSLAVSPEGIPWKLDFSGNVSERTGPGAWATRGSGFLAWEVAVGRADDAWAISRTGCTRDRNFVPIDCPIFQWASNQWIQHSGAARHVAVAPDGTTYVTNSSGTIYKFNGSSFVQWGGTMLARDRSHGDTLGWPVIGAASNDSVWIIADSGSGADYPIYAWLAETSVWQQISGAYGTTISVGADGTPWVLNSSTNIFEYVTSWQAMGPFGFSFPDGRGNTDTWSGQLQDVAIPTGGGEIVVASTSGGVWENLLNWGAIADRGAGVTVQGQARAPGPNSSIGSVSVSPTDAKTVIVGTGVSESSNWSNDQATNSWGNGIWYTHNAITSPVSWTKAPTNVGDPRYVIKLRYNSDASKIFAATDVGLLIGTQDANGNITFSKAGSTCQPTYGGYQFTDLVTDPSDANTFYVGVSSEGVYHSADGGQTCTSSAPGPLYIGDSSTITNVALAITSSSVVYASVAGSVYNQNNDFQGIFSTSTWPPTWNTVVYGPAGAQYQNLRSQSGHNWALSTNPNGDVILAGGADLWRFSGCSPTNCTEAAEVDAAHNHQDSHAILWGSDGIVYVVNDGGLFTSSDNGVSWNDGINTLGVANEVSVAVNNAQAPHVFASAWDVGVNYTLDGSTWQGIPGAPILDGWQVVANDASFNTQYVFACGYDGYRYYFDGTAWSSVDNPQIAASSPCDVAISTISGEYPTTIYNSQLYYSYNDGQNWYPYAALPGGNPWSVQWANDPDHTFYAAISGQQALDVTWSNAPNNWQYAAVPPNWTTDYRVGGTFAGAAAAMTANNVTGDAYLVGVNGSGVSAIVSSALAPSHGGTWNPMTGAGALMLNQSERVNTIATDPSTHGVIVGTEARLAGGGDGNSIYRVSNPDVIECPLCTASHHWRPWVYGLPNATQPVEWIAGQYENGVYYYYIATWGRGVWKREARGGDF